MVVRIYVDEDDGIQDFPLSCLREGSHLFEQAVYMFSPSVAVDRRLPLIFDAHLLCV